MEKITTADLVRLHNACEVEHAEMKEKLPRANGKEKAIAREAKQRGRQGRDW